jgi:uroporphyrinogen decarboxylase
VAQENNSIENDIQLPRFLAACRRQAVDATPVWFMRQAGRYMQEYQAIRAKASLLKICQTPELAVEVTLQPLRVLGVDAAILFADILLPAIPLGVGVSFVEGKGPIIHRPIRSIKDVQALKPFDPNEELSYVYETIRLLRAELKGIPLIGFCGAPFTFAAYLIEGGTSRNFILTKTMMYAAPETWFALLEGLTDVLIEYLTAQIRAGAQAVQVLYMGRGCFRRMITQFCSTIFGAFVESRRKGRSAGNSLWHSNQHLVEADESSRRYGVGLGLADSLG